VRGGQLHRFGRDGAQDPRAAAPGIKPTVLELGARTRYRVRDADLDGRRPTAMATFENTPGLLILGRYLLIRNPR